mgnify:CR=1 FL=1
MRLNDIPIIGNKITKDDEILIDQIGSVISTIVEKMEYISFTDSIIILSGIAHGLINYREGILTSEDAGFESIHDVLRYNYLVRLINKKYGFDMQEVMIPDIDDK